MRWYERLYVGERAKEHRAAILGAIRRGKISKSFVLTPASNKTDILDIYPAFTLLCPCCKQREELLIVGVAADYDDALELSARIVSDMYRETGGFDLTSFLNIDKTPAGK